ncbi:DUF1330 domain-containing protein [Aestuariispira ectoiniformans]|uniref:DUF1330 domain-containing protein n=1 Tax=Aestuariispira ectoiniformans TaxID=2775080 RepID=UPI00223B2F67|nr:DUF1330 domain-containing protein [Aestuariispira ectoiniformans]
MKAYAIADLHSVDMGPEIVQYLENIDETLAPFEGRFIVHGGAKSVVEGTWPGDLIIVEFPSKSAAQAWYASPAYQRILALRANNSDGDVAIVEGVSPGHRATDILTSS